MSKAEDTSSTESMDFGKPKVAFADKENERAKPGRTSPLELFRIWHRNGVHHVQVVMMCYSVGLLAFLPFLPQLSANYFASMRVHTETHCEDYTTEFKPSYCTEAYGKSATYGAWTAFVSNCFLSALISPVIGHYSDLTARRPFLVGALGVSLLPALAVSAHVFLDASLLWYYAAATVAYAANPFSIAMSFVSDVVPQENLTTFFGILYMTFPLALILTAAFAVSTPEVACIGALVLLSCAVVYTLCFLPETLCPQARENARKEHKSDSFLSVFSGLAKGWGIISRSSLFIKLTLLVMVCGLSLEGFQDIVAQYLQLELDFMPQDIGVMFALFGFMGILTSAVIMPSLLAFVTEQKVILVGLCGLVVEFLLLAIASTKAIAFLGLAIGPLGLMAFPSIAAIKSRNVREHEQGAMQGALVGARSFAQGVGPLLFSAIFNWALDQGESSYYGTPMYVGALLIAVAIVITATIPPSAAYARFGTPAPSEYNSGSYEASSDGSNSPRKEKNAVLPEGESVRSHDIDFAAVEDGDVITGQPSGMMRNGDSN